MITPLEKKLGLAIIAVLVAVFVAGGMLSLIGAPEQAHAQSVQPLDKWVATSSPNAGITQRTYGQTLIISGLTAGQCLTVDANGKLGTTACSSGGAADPFTHPSYGGSATTSLLTLTGGLLVNNASSTIVGNATTTGMQGVGSIYINGQRFTAFLGSGLSNSAGVLTVSGLGTSNFTSANVSQFTNDSGYATFTYPFPAGATTTLLKISGGLIVNNASTTIVGNATTTGSQGVGSLYINNDYLTDLTGSGLVDTAGALSVSGLTTTQFSSANVSQWTNDAGYITSSGSGAPFAWTPGTYNGQAINATSTGLRITNTASPLGLIASSTFITYASTTQLSIGSKFYTDLQGAGLALSAAGVLSNSGVLSLGNGTGVTCTGTNPGSCSLAAINANSVLANQTSASAIPSQIATSTFFGIPTPGTILAFLSGQNTYVSTTTLNVGTATALAANGTNCSAGNAPLGVDASGNSEGCFAVAAFGYDFVPATNFAVNSNSTTTPLWLKNGLFASTTSANPIWLDQVQIGSSTLGTLSTSTDYGNFVIKGNASTTDLTVSNIQSALIVTGAGGHAGPYAGASACGANNFVTTISAVGGTSCGTASINATYTGMVQGSASAALGGTFAFTSPAWPWTTTSVFGTTTSATTTPLWLQTGFFASTTPTAPARIDNLALGSSTPTSFANSPLVVSGNVNSYVQTSLQNLNAGANASTCQAIHNNLSTDTTYYGEFCINSSGYTTAGFNSQNQNDVSFIASDNALVIGTASTTNSLAELRFITGGTASSSIRAVITQTGKFGIGTTSPYAALSVVGSSGIVADHYTATSTTQPSAFAGGLTAYASSTIGNGNANGGLSVSGNATTTGIHVTQGSATSTYVGGVSTQGTIDAQSTTASSTFSNGIVLKGGCVLIGSTCLGSTAAAPTRYVLNDSAGTVTSSGATQYATSTAVVVAAGIANTNSILEARAFLRCSKSNTDNTACQFWLRDNGRTIWTRSFTGGPGSAANVTCSVTIKMIFNGALNSESVVDIPKMCYDNSSTLQDTDIFDTSQIAIDWATGTHSLAWTVHNDGTGNLTATAEGYDIVFSQ